MTRFIIVLVLLGCATGQESARELAREDLPMRKYNRSTFFGERLLNTSVEKDYEFDLSDADADVAPDPTPSTG